MLFRNFDDRVVAIGAGLFYLRTSGLMIFITRHHDKFDYSLEILYRYDFMSVLSDVLVDLELFALSNLFLFDLNS